MSQEVEEAHVATGNNLVDQKIVKENGSSGGKFMPSDSNDKLIEMVVELDFQNEYMKAQYVNFKKYLSEYELNSRPKVLEHGEQVSEGDGGMLHGEIEPLKRQLLEERQARDAAEESLKHLKAAHSEADSKALELTTRLAEAQQRMDQELKVRDEKYSELDSKFSRLHKRAKLRIQEVQKEKDDIEVQLREVSEKAERSSSQLSELQQELDRTRQHANEALKAMDVERQQLRMANNKLSDAIDELRHSLASKENALEAAHQSLLEKDQMLEESYGLLKVADEKQQAAISEVSAKHQKEVEDLEAQIADFISERNHAVETISSLQALIAQRDTKIAEIDAASSGEAARLKASIETLKGELSNQKNEHDIEKEGFEAMSRSLLSKLEISERNRVYAEVEAAKFKSQLESELTERTQLVNNKDLDLQEANEKIKSIENEFASYKARAHALLQRKDAELASARDNDHIKALEEAIKDAEREVQVASLEKDKAFEDLKDALSNSEKEISNRDAALSKAEQRIKTLQMKLDSVLSNYQSDKESWDRTQKNMEETWRTKYEDLERKCAESPDNNLQAEVERLKLHCKTLKEEKMSLQDLADKLMEEKDKEITRLWNEINNLQKLLDSRPSVEDLTDQKDFTRQETSNASSVAAEQQILILARQQAQREEELAQTQRHILALQEEIEELEHENRLHKQQEAMLKEELRNAERAQKRDGVDLTYLKNVVLKLLETGEVERLLPVVAMLLQFSPDEIQKCQQAYSSASLT